MLPNNFPSIAYIHDWLVTRGGAERTLEAALEISPQANVFTLVYRPEEFTKSIIAQHPVHTSFLNRFPRAQKQHRVYLPLMPLAVEQYDLRPYPMLVSISSAVAHGIVPRPDQRHIAYVSTPARYAWHLYHDYLEDNGLTRGLNSWIARLVLHYLRLWDTVSAKRVDHFVAISNWVAQCIWRTYRQNAEVIYPPVDIDRFQPQSRRDDFYLTVSRHVSYKKIPLIVDAFTQLDYPLIVIGDGPDYARAAKRAGPNVQLLGQQPDKIVSDLMGRGRAFIHMAEEDFGIAMVEAQAAGCPVIAFGRGGALEVVIDEKTGLFFSEQTAESLMDAVRLFEGQRENFKFEDLRQNAERFAKDRFLREFAALLERQYDDLYNLGKKGGSQACATRL